MKTDDLRADLGQAVDAIIDEYLQRDGQAPTAAAGTVRTHGVMITRGDEGEPFTYRWPGDAGTEEFHESR